MSNKIYDILKWIALIFLPALGTLYFGLAKIWGLPFGTEIVGTISTIDAFLGGLLGISSVNYYAEKVQTNVNNDSQDELIEEGVVENED